LNNNYYVFRNIYPVQYINKNSVKLSARYLPRFGISYRIYNNLVWRASVSKGYSPPTISELRPSDNVIYQNLMPEYGWNYETGLRYRSMNERWSADVVYFRYDLQNAIVRRLNEDGAEFFVNAGGTRQEGLEAETRMTLIKNDNSFIRLAEINLSYTLYYFRFVNYQSGDKDHSSNSLTGIPSNTFNGGISISLPVNLVVYVNYNYTGRLPLNDSNTDWASDYHLLRSKISWSNEIKKATVVFFAGIDNILDEKYSLGNDLNAAAGRYYNPAPTRNFYGGIAVNVK
jgi:iron complex outermembrane receptor protein